MNIDIIKIITEKAAMGHEDSAEMLDKISLAVIGDHIVKEIRRRVDADHISDIVVAPNDKGKRDNVKLKFSEFYELLDAKCEKRQPDKSIDPHRVVLLYHSIG